MKTHELLALKVLLLPSEEDSKVTIKATDLLDSTQLAELRRFTSCKLGLPDDSMKPTTEALLDDKPRMQVCQICDVDSCIYALINRK